MVAYRMMGKILNICGVVKNQILCAVKCCEWSIYQAVSVFLFQVAGKQLLPMPSQRLGWPMLSPQHAAKATSVSVDVTGRSRVIIIRRKAGNGEDARQTSSTA